MSGATAINQRAAPARGGKGQIDQYVSFLLGDGQYAVPIDRVQEIKGWDTVTRVPYTPPFVLGVVNLRGEIVPVIDLRLRFELPEAPYDASTVIVVVRVPAERGERTAGLVVDAVSDVHDVPSESMQSAPALSGMSDQAFILGVAQLQDRLVVLLDVDRLVSACILAGANS
jgi:purine-binding chemotaxis protein CheW